MNHSRYLADSGRSPYPRRRRALVPQSPDLARSLPAITVLEPIGYRLEPRSFSPDRSRREQNMTPRPLSPGAFRIAPQRSAKNKITSFVILNEELNSPVTSRAPSPSGRVSPFRGHGFKSPTSSRPTSKAASPLHSPSRKKQSIYIVPPKPENKDIGLPPKSPKRAVKSTQLKEFKPALKPKPILTNNNKTMNNKAVENGKKLKNNGNKKSMIMSTVDQKKDKKPPVPPKKSDLQKSPAKIKKEISNATEDNKESVEIQKAENVISDDPVVVSKVKTKNVAHKEEIQNPKKDVEEKLVPTFQPDKYVLVPPTMASPAQTIATSTNTTPSVSATTSKVASSSISAISSAISLTDSLAKKSSISKPKTEEISKPSTPKPANAPSDNVAMTKQLEKPIVVNGNLAPSPGNVETVVATITTVDEIIKSRIGSAASQKSGLMPVSPTLSERTRSSMVTVRAVSSGSIRGDETNLNIPEGSTGEVISTTKLIRSDPDLEVLSPNNLLRSSPPDSAREPLWENNRLPNGDASGSNERKGRCARFFASFWRLITYICCCCKRWSCCVPGISRWACCKSRKCCKRKNTEETTTESSTKCCRCSNPFTALRSCFQKLNCCKNFKCSSCCKSACCQRPLCKKCSPCCDKIKCCEGKSCCKRTKKKKGKSTTKNMCCAKPSCSCKKCCESVKECCISCNEGVNNCCRALFCLNLMCCQRCLRKCACCQKYKCCQKGGCCSCCNPNVKREQRAKLDKKTSRASNKSTQSREKLDAALVEHASVMKAAIPVLPSCLAWLCLLFNFLIPGTGTLLSGILCLCFGKPRFSVNDSPQNRFSAFLVNLVIAISQAFTIIFCLVGWGWSMWWGVIMVKLARKQKRLRLAEKNQEAAPSNANQNHVDPEAGRAR